MAESKSNCKATTNFSIEHACRSNNYLKNLQEVIQSHPDETAKNFGMSVVYLLASNHKKVLECLEKIVKEKPALPLIHRRIAEVFLLEQDFPKAINCLEKALELDKKDLTAKIWLTLSYYKIGDTDKAEVNLSTLEDYILFLNASDSNWI